MNAGAKLTEHGANLITGQRADAVAGGARESGPDRNPSIYMAAVCLGRLLMGEKRVVVIKGTRIPSSSSASFEDVPENIIALPGANVFLRLHFSLQFRLLLALPPS